MASSSDDEKSEKKEIDSPESPATPERKHSEKSNHKKKQFKKKMMGLDLIREQSSMSNKSAPESPLKKIIVIENASSR